MENTPKEISPEAFAKCLQLLRGPSDEERFTGLLIVSKLIKADDTEKIKQVLDAIGFNFINRLLTSKPNAEGFSYKSLALSILSTFSVIPELTRSADFITKAPIILDILETSDDAHTIDDAFQCLHAIGSSEQGQTELFASVHHGIRSLAKGLVKSLSSDKLPQHLEFFLHYVLYVREHIQAFPEISQLGKDLAVVIPQLSSIFKENQEMLKFYILNTLLAIITSIKDLPLSDLVRSSATWSEDLRIGLFSILTGKVNEQYRDPAIILTSILVENLGPSWAWGTKGNPGSEGMFAELIIRLARIEIQLILEQPDNFIPKATLLTSCYSILETAISYLSTDSWKFNSERLENVQKTSLDVFSLILKYILYCKEQDLKTDPIGLLSIRVLAVWMSEDTSSLRAEIFEALPFILEMHPLENDPTGAYDPFPVMIPALLNLTSEPDPLNLFVKGNGPQRLFQYINANCLSLTQALIKKDEKAANNALSMLGSCFGICLNLLSIPSEFDVKTMACIFPSLSSSMELLCANVQNDADRLYILANMVTITLSLMRKLDYFKNLQAAYPSIIAFYLLVGTREEDSITDLWLLGLYGLADCLHKDNSFLDAVGNSKLPQIFADRVAATEMTDDEVQQWNVILTILATKSQKARQTLLVHGGLQLAAKKSFTQLQKVLSS